MREHHEFCQLRIDGLKDTIATLTEQLEHTERESFARYEAHLKAEAQLTAAEKDRDEWKEAAIYEKDQGTQRMWDNLRLVAQRDAAEKVCEAVAGLWYGDEAWERVEDAKADWRRTKDGALSQHYRPKGDTRPFRGEGLAQ